jgi:hypothetical protein
MFVHFNGKIHNANTITHIDYSGFVPHGYIFVSFSDCPKEEVTGQEAFEVVMRLCPEALEGQNTKEQKGRWAIHNFFGHPLMQIFSWLGCTELGLKIHDWTVPNREVDDG